MLLLVTQAGTSITLSPTVTALDNPSGTRALPWQGLPNTIVVQL